MPDTVKPPSGDARSYDVAFVPFCMLCRGVVARNLVNTYSSVIEPVVRILMDANINIVQMPCPELQHAGVSAGLRRQPMTKDEYDTPGFNSACAGLAKECVHMMSAVVGEGFRIRCVLGIDYSPSCAVRFIFKTFSGTYSSRGYTEEGQGIFIERLQRRMHEEGLEAPFVGIHLRGMEKSLDILKETLRRDETEVPLNQQRTLW